MKQAPRSGLHHGYKVEVGEAQVVLYLYPCGDVPWFCCSANSSIRDCSEAPVLSNDFLCCRSQHIV